MGEDFNSVFNAATGQRGDAPREGIFKTFILSGDWRVLDHLMMTWAPGGAKMISPLANCLRGSYEEIECGTKFEILRKVKKDRRKEALNT